MRNGASGQRDHAVRTLAPGLPRPNPLSDDQIRHICSAKWLAYGRTGSGLLSISASDGIRLVWAFSNSPARLTPITPAWSFSTSLANNRSDRASLDAFVERTATSSHYE
jgi:hypothetical protein